MIRAKFRCSEVRDAFTTSTATSPSEKYAEVVTLHAVAATDGPNAEWAKYTPSGQLTMQIDNPGAWGRFEQGKEYFLDLTPAG